MANIKLARIDYRLLHGQVVFSWTKTLSVQRIIVVDDDAAGDDFKKMTLNLSKPADIRLNIFTLEETLRKMEKVETLDENIMLIFGNTKTTLGFFTEYTKIKEINYGGIANKEGAKQYSNAIFLTEEEVEDSRKLANLGYRLYMQQVPTSKIEELNDKL